MTTSSDKPRIGFLSMPNLGGWLSILYCLFCLLAMTTPLIEHSSPIAQRILIAILSFPFKESLLASHDFWLSNVPAFAVVTAIDCFIWGYGIAALWRMIVRCRERRFRLALFDILVLITILAIVFAAAYYRRR